MFFGVDPHAVMPIPFLRYVGYLACAATLGVIVSGLKICIEEQLRIRRERKNLERAVRAVTEKTRMRSGFLREP